MMSWRQGLPGLHKQAGEFKGPDSSAAQRRVAFARLLGHPESLSHRLISLTTLDSDRYNSNEAISIIICHDNYILAFAIEPKINTSTVVITMVR